MCKALLLLKPWFKWNYWWRHTHVFCTKLYGFSPVYDMLSSDKTTSIITGESCSRSWCQSCKTLQVRLVWAPGVMGRHTKCDIPKKHINTKTMMFRNCSIVEHLSIAGEVIFLHNSAYMPMALGVIGGRIITLPDQNCDGDAFWMYER